MDRGVWDPVNVNLFPKAAKAIHDARVPATEVFFARLVTVWYLARVSFLFFVALLFSN